MTEGNGASPVRTVIVDDSTDIRTMLRLVLGRDPRFEVVGEASDGLQAIEVTRSTQPDLVIIDLVMPLMGGLDAMPEIRRGCPGCQVILYTSSAHSAVEEEALSQGAVGVIDKTSMILDVPQQVVQLVLNRHQQAADTVEVRVGPVDSAAARIWVANTRKLLAAVQEHPEVIGSPVPGPVMDVFCSFLDSWGAMAEGTDEFVWMGRARPADVEAVVAEWARIDAMTDDQLEALGVQWAPPEGRPFFEALTSGVFEALRNSDQTKALAERFAAQFDTV